MVSKEERLLFITGKTMTLRTCTLVESEPHACETQENILDCRGCEDGPCLAHKHLKRSENRF